MADSNVIPKRKRRIGNLPGPDCPTYVHGLSDSPIHAIWTAMKARCQNPNDQSYENYGARGIKVCARWQTFANFFADMGHRPDGKSLDRKDNNGDYSPENCRWATRKEQQNNLRKTTLITAFSETKPISEWSDKFGVSRDAITYRLKRGCPPERAVSDPPSFKQRNRYPPK